MYNTIIAAILIVAFFMCVSSFIWGVKIGKQLGNSQIPITTINPVKKVVQAVETHKAKKDQEELQDIMEASRETMLQAIKSEVK